MMLPDENKSPVSEDLIPGSKKLFLFFGGIAGAIGVPPFEFYRASRILEHSRIFLRAALLLHLGFRIAFPTCLPEFMYPQQTNLICVTPTLLEDPWERDMGWI